MRIRRRFLRVLLATAAMVASGFAVPAAADVEFRCAHVEQLASHGAEPSVLDALREACPLLGRIVEELALRDLGEATMTDAALPHDDALARGDMAAIAALAASGDVASARQLAERAVRSGATRDELIETLYLIVLNGGIAQAIEMTRMLSGVLIEADEEELAGMLIEAHVG